MEIGNVPTVSIFDIFICVKLRAISRLAIGGGGGGQHQLLQHLVSINDAAN